MPRTAPGRQQAAGPESTESPKRLVDFDDPAHRVPIEYPPVDNIELIPGNHEVFTQC